jgi:hypothetical protein
MYMTFTHHELDGQRIYKVMHAWFDHDACRVQAAQLRRATVPSYRQGHHTCIQAECIG